MGIGEVHYPGRQAASASRRRCREVLAGSFCAGMNPLDGLVLAVVISVIFFFVLYGVIRAGVRDGIFQADEPRRSKKDAAIKAGTPASQSTVSFRPALSFPRIPGDAVAAFPPCPHLPTACDRA
jgi:hypothetical protein